MPIEIRELVIRATVEPDAERKDGAGCGLTSSGGGKKGTDKPGAGASGGGGAELVQDCVREVLRILESRRER